VLNRYGPTPHVKAQSTDGRPIVVDIGNDLDVANSLGDSQHARVVQVAPVNLDTQELKAGWAGSAR
jgi:hypothetical protein